MSYETLRSQVDAVLEHIKEYGAESLNIPPDKSQNLARALASTNRLAKMIREEMREG